MSELKEVLKQLVAQMTAMINLLTMLVSLANTIQTNVRWHPRKIQNVPTVVKSIQLTIGAVW